MSVEQRPAALAALLAMAALVAACLCASGCTDEARPRSVQRLPVDDGVDARADAFPGEAPAAPPDAGSLDSDRDPALSSPDAAPTSPCAALCERIASAGCPAQKPCLPACAKATAEPACGAVYERWATCAARQPPSSFACDTRGQGALDASLCVEELLGFGDCLLSG